MGILWTAGAAC